jgi:hypothetical protein
LRQEAGNINTRCLKPTPGSRDDRQPGCANLIVPYVGQEENRWAPFAKLRYGSKEYPLFQNRLKNRLNSEIQAGAAALARPKKLAISIGRNGAPEEIRTPAPQIRSLV